MSISDNTVGEWTKPDKVGCSPIISNSPGLVVVETPIPDRAAGSNPVCVTFVDMNHCITERNANDNTRE